MKDKKNEFYAFLDERKESTMAEAAKLLSDDRRDESNILKAKANIYDIFKAIWGASEKMCQGDFKEDFLLKSANIYGPWEKSLEAAIQHDDTTKIMIEEAKLQAVAEVMAKVEEL